MILIKRIAPKSVSFLITAASVLLAGIFMSVLLIVTGKNPAAVFSTMFSIVFNDTYGFSETVVKMIPLSLCALSVCVAAAAGLWNVGAEGQLYIGGCAAGITALFLPVDNSFLMLAAMALTASLAGGIYGACAGLLKTRFNINEILSTLMLNYIAICFTEFLVYGPLKGKDGFPYSERIPDSAVLSVIHGRIHTGIFAVMVLTTLCWFILKKTTWGMNLRIINQSENTARYCALNIEKNTVFVMAAAGALAGIAGMIEISAIQGRLLPVISDGYGYSGIIVAWLANISIPACPLVAFLFGGLYVSGDEIQIVHHIPSAITKIFQGFLFLFFLCGSLFQTHTIRRSKK